MVSIGSSDIVLPSSMLDSWWSWALARGRAAAASNTAAARRPGPVAIARGSMLRFRKCASDETTGACSDIAVEVGRLVEFLLFGRVSRMPPVTNNSRRAGRKLGRRRGRRSGSPGRGAGLAWKIWEATAMSLSLSRSLSPFLNTEGKTFSPGPGAR